MITAIKKWWYTRKMLNVQEFAHAHPEFLVIVADPRDNTTFVAYRGKQVTSRIASMDGVEYNVVKNLLRHSKFATVFDQFSAHLIEVLGVALTHPAMNKFIELLDAAIFRITKTLKFNNSP